MTKRLRRRDSKKMGIFMKDHCWGWRPPMKLRKIRWDDTTLEKCSVLREVAVEAGRKRMVARGLFQYANAEEIKGLSGDQISEFERKSGRKLVDGEFRYIL